MTKELTLEQKAANYETMRHIERVRDLLGIVIVDLLRRASEHDQSKLESPEVEAFTEYTPKLAESTYDSPEYEEFLRKMAPALAHHFDRNISSVFPNNHIGMTLTTPSPTPCPKRKRPPFISRRSITEPSAEGSITPVN